MKYVLDGHHLDARARHLVHHVLHRKTVTSATSLRNMHVTLNMVEVLGLHEIEPLPGTLTEASTRPSEMTWHLHS